MASCLRPRCLPRTPIHAAALAALACCLLNASARADDADDEPPTAAVIPFAAQPPGQPALLAGACEHALKRIQGLRVIGAIQWERESRESGQGDDLEAMARRLGADVLVTGALSRRPQGYRLSVDLFDDKGQPIQSFEIDLLVPVIGPAAAFRLEEALAKIIRPVVGLREQAETPPDGGPEPAPQSSDREKIVPLAEVEGIRPQAGPQRKTEWPPWRPLIEAHLGLNVVGRSLSCDAAEPARLNLPCTDTLFPFDGGAGLRMDLGLFPLARMPLLPKALLGLGVGLLLEVPAWRDRVLSTDGTTSGVRQLRIEGGLRWRWNIGDRVRRPILELGLAYGMHQFTLTNDAIPYPDLQYQYLLPSIGLGSYVSPQLHLRGAFALLGIVTSGQASEVADDQNQNPFGAGRAIGFRLLAEAEYLVWRKLSLGLGGSLERVSHSFDGTGCTKSAPRQAVCDRSIIRSMPPPPSISAATDLHLGLWLQVGYRY